MSAGAHANGNGAVLELRGVGFAYGSLSVIDGLDLVVRPGELVVCVGPSGCGKSTLLALLGGHLAPTRGSREQALLAYTKLAENACRAVRHGGLLVLCSCSAAVDLAALTRALATGSTRASAQATVLERWFQGPDHPVPAAFGEGLYLKALIARIEGR